MEILGQEHSLNVFFNLIQAKGVWKGTWCSLNAIPSRRLFGLFHQNYKGFKNLFFMVRSAESEWPFYLEDNTKAAGLEKFPLYWQFDIR